MLITNIILTLSKQEWNSLQSEVKGILFPVLPNYITTILISDIQQSGPIAE
ncbi:hypothetical protein [Bacillus toyonensis]|uniref:hypothetical protein n=1 Tax=Bacillus toyonensis TaxID=155322 RepID=UPI0015D514C6|nr:hypothetical protein [Bacillus toyonensis]